MKDELLFHLNKAQNGCARLMERLHDKELQDILTVDVANQIDICRVLVESIQRPEVEVLDSRKGKKC